MDSEDEDDVAVKPSKTAKGKNSYTQKSIFPSTTKKAEKPSKAYALVLSSL